MAAALALVIAGITVGKFGFPSNDSVTPVIVSRSSPPPVPAVVIPAVPAKDRPSAPGNPAQERDHPKLVAAPAQSPDLANEVARQTARVRQLETELAEARAATAQERSSIELAQKEIAANAQAGKRVADLETRIESLSNQIRFYQTALAARRGDSALTQSNLLALLSSPNTALVNLAATGHMRAATARALVSPGNRLVFVASGLPALPAGRTYQLWILRNTGAPVQSGGIFVPDTKHGAVLEVSNQSLLQGVTALAVTEEPAGGVPLPTGPRLLFGLEKSS